MSQRARDNIVQAALALDGAGGCADFFETLREAWKTGAK
jgi:hypothetical protein